jgi:nucleotide-binding universal stress UspA family protein
MMIQTVAVGTDGSDTASKAVEFALDIAEKFGAKVVVASSYRPVGEDRIRRDQRDAPDDIQWTINPTQDVDSALRSVEDKARDRGLEVASEARQGDPADVLCEIAEEHGADLLVVGNKGMQRRVLGSVPNSVSHKAPCSVVIVKTT